MDNSNTITRSSTIAALLHPFSYPGRKLDSKPINTSSPPRNLPAANTKEITSVMEKHVSVVRTLANASTDVEANNRDHGYDYGSGSHLVTSSRSCSMEDDDSSEFSTSVSSVFLTSFDPEGDEDTTTSIVPTVEPESRLPMPRDKIVPKAKPAPIIVRKDTTNPEFENEYFSVSRSEIADWGAVASQDLEYGDVILREYPLFTTDTDRDIFAEFHRLDQQTKDVALSLHANDRLKDGTPRLKAVWATNCFGMDGHRAGLFAIAARFNHACEPSHNIDYVFDDENGCLSLTVRADRVFKGEELTISYGRGRTPGILYLWYGFRCQCGACPGLSDAEVWELTSPW